MSKSHENKKKRQKNKIKTIEGGKESKKPQKEQKMQNSLKKT